MKDKTNKQIPTLRLFLLTSESNERPSEDTTHVCVHSSVKEVFPKEFENFRAIQHLHLSKGVQCIGAKAFKDCSNLRTVTMASSLKSIGYRSFYFTSLVTVNLQEGSLQTIGFAAFGSCKFLQTVQLPRTLQKIEDWAFSHCVALVNISIPAGVETIGRLAFLGCSALPKIYIPNTVEALGEWAFQDCTLLQNVRLEEPTLLQEIGTGTFSNCKGLEHMSVPMGIEMIGGESFRDCICLRSVDLPEGLTRIHSKAFLGCLSLVSMVIPSTTIEIGDRAFYGCTSLLGVELKDGISKNIQYGSKAFANCPNLVNIALSSVQPIPQDVFAGCTKLRVKDKGDGDTAVVQGTPCCLPALQHRFAKLPVHEACYHSSTTTTEYLLTCIQESLEKEEASSDDDGDDFQMTPFHVLVTATVQRTDLLQVLLDHYPLGVLAQKDSNHCTMMEYLLVDQRPTSLSLIQLVLGKTLVDGMMAWGEASWKRSLQDSIRNEWMLVDNAVTTIRKQQALQKLHRQLESYSRCEVLSLLELAVWKSNIRRESMLSNKDETSLVHRDHCRLLCGANIIKAKVFCYLCGGDNDSPEAFVSNSIFPYNLSWMSDAAYP